MLIGLLPIQPEKQQDMQLNYDPSVCSPKEKGKKEDDDEDEEETHFGGLRVDELLECIRHWLLPKPQSDWLRKSEMQDAVTQQRNSEGDFKGDRSTILPKDRAVLKAIVIGAGARPLMFVILVTLLLNSISRFTY